MFLLKAPMCLKAVAKRGSQVALITTYLPTYAGADPFYCSHMSSPKILFYAFHLTVSWQFPIHRNHQERQLATQPTGATLTHA
jgi:hypothetical protein